MRTCLLISDDPDDYAEFSEALYEIARDTVLIAVADANRAAELLAAGTCVPEFVFLNRSVNGTETSNLFAVLSQPRLHEVKLFVWGDLRGLPDAERLRITSSFDLDMTFAALKELLRSIVGPV